MSAAVSVADLLSARWDATGEAALAHVWLPAGFEVTYVGPDGREVRAGLDRRAHPPGLPPLPAGKDQVSPARSP